MASKKDIEAGGAFVRLFLKDDLTKKLGGTLKAAGARVQQFGSSVRQMGIPIAAAGATITAGLGATVATFASMGDHLGKMSARTGIAASSLAELGFAAEQSGTDLDVIEKGIRRQQKNILDLERGLSTATNAFSDLGLTLADVKDLSPEDQFELITDRLAGVQDATRRAALAQELFGRAGTALIPMLGSVRALRQEARDLGIVPTDDEVKKAEMVTDAINRVRRVAKQMLFNIGAALAGPVLDGLDIIKRIAVETGRWIKENAELVKIIAAVGIGLLAIGTTLIGVGSAISIVGFALSGIGTAIAAIGSMLAIVISPIGLIVAGLAIAAAAWIRFTDSGKRALSGFMSTLSRIREFASKVFAGIKDALVAGDIALAGQIAFTALELAARQVLDALASMFGDTFGTIANQILAGDLSGAWETVADGMLQVWRDFQTAVIEMFAGIVVSIQKMWTDMQNKISNMVIEWSTQDTAMGAAARAVLGVDLRDATRQEADRRRAFDAARQSIDLMEQQRTEAQQQGDTAAVADLDVRLQEARDKLAAGEYRLAPEFNAAAEAKRIVDEMTAATQSAFQTEGLGGTLLNAAAEAREAARELAAARAEAEAKQTDEANARVAVLEERLAALRKQAASEAEKARAKRAKKAAAGSAADEEAGTAGGVRPLFQATYSAAAAQVAGFQGTGGQNPQEKTATAVEQLKKEVETHKQFYKDLVEATLDTGRKIGEFVAAMTYQ